ncbi:MAG: PepSY domain-containing protein [Hydrogenibacillus schlegelii]|uniref:PepSY domain-containing protein n=1 Tax=Hydrogenibacillus schlegelii TaxID=1484 RepID=A0A947CWH0_HYDSH|nr:PepSY domain-containing protein [Hydrogenibacillus schlegelii]
MKKQTIGLALALSVLAGGSLGLWYAHASASSPSKAPAGTTEAEAAGVKTEAKDARETPEAPEKAETDDRGAEVHEQANEEGESRDAAVLAREAAVSMQQAERRALAHIPGTAIKTTLERVSGRTVYEVRIKEASGRISEVKVDAKTGIVLPGDSLDNDQEEVEHRD